MIDFLIKSGISMAVLLAVYHLFLEREKMHVFNRFYLLAALTFSVALPFITITIYTEATGIPAIITENSIVTASNTPLAIVNTPTTSYMPYIIWGMYSLITCFMLLRFIKNIRYFTKQISTCTVVPYKSSRLVLVDADILPHTFLNYIFLNKKSYQDRTVEEELYAHELVHVTQRHTLDILFIETLKVFFWFNPLLYLYKTAIQLNHEFLADDDVIAATKNVISYQQLLLEKAAPATYYHLASSLNFSITKKRFTMMTKTTTRSRALVLKLASLPTLAALLLMACNTTERQRMPSAKNDNIVITEVTKAQMDSLKEANPKEFGKVNLSDVKQMTYSRLGDKGKIVKEVSFIVMEPDTTPIKLYPEEPAIDPLKLSAIETTRLTVSQMDSMRTANPGLFSTDENVKYEGTKLKLTDAKGVVTEKISYSQMSQNDKAEDNTMEQKGQKKSNPIPKLSTTFNNTQEDKVHNAAKVDEHPQFPGGITGFYRFISENYQISEEPTGLGKIYISFVIEKDGTTSNLKILRDPTGGSGGKEVLRVLKLAPNWTPGKLNGEVVRTSYSLPITIMKKA